MDRLLRTILITLAIIILVVVGLLCHLFKIAVATYPKWEPFLWAGLIVFFYVTREDS